MEKQPTVYDYLVRMTKGQLMYASDGENGFQVCASGVFNTDEEDTSYDGISFQFLIDDNVVYLPSEIMDNAETFYDEALDCIGIRYNRNGVMLEIEASYLHEGFTPERSETNEK